MELPWQSLFETHWSLEVGKVKVGKVRKVKVGKSHCQVGRSVGDGVTHLHEKVSHSSPYEQLTLLVHSRSQTARKVHVLRQHTWFWSHSESSLHSDCEWTLQMKQIKAKQSESDQICINSLSKIKQQMATVQLCKSRKWSDEWRSSFCRRFCPWFLRASHVTAAMETGKIRKCVMPHFRWQGLFRMQFSKHPRREFVLNAFIEGFRRVFRVDKLDPRYSEY